MNHRLRLIPLLLALALVSGDSWARIKLITLPVREQVEIQLTHPAATLVEEERIVPLVEGSNQLDFSWGNTSIDPGSILLRLLENEQPLSARVLSVSYPPGENTLIWNLWADQAGAARVRIGYLIGGLEKTFHYRATADKEERKLVLQQFLRLKNNAGESFDDSLIKAGVAAPLRRSLGVAETKELLIAEYPEVAITKRYTADLVNYGYIDAPKNKLRIPMHYVLKNHGDHGLGEAALPFGKARIFIEDGKGGNAFIGEDWGQFTPRDDEMALYLGVARDIVVTRSIQRNQAERINGNLYNYDILLKYEIENFKDQPLVLDIVEDVRHIRQQLGRANSRDIEWQLGPETSFPSAPDPERSGIDKLVFQLPLEARSGEGKPPKLTHYLHLKLRNEW